MGGLIKMMWPNSIIQGKYDLNVRIVFKKNTIQKYYIILLCKSVF
jgi:hypothetical protein